MRARTREPLLALLGLCLVACGSAAAQEGAAPGSGASTSAADAPEEDVLSPSEVAVAGQQVNTALHRLRARVHHVRELEHHIVVIDRLGREVQRLRVDSDLESLETQPRRELRNLREQWVELDARLEEIGNALETSAAALEEDAATVRETEERWERTAEAALENAYPPSAVAQITEILALVAEVTAELRAHLERVLGAQTRLSDHAITTGDVLAELDRAIEASQARLFTRTHEPGLAGMPERAVTPLARQLEVAAVHHLHALDRFVTHLGGRGYVHGALIVALLLFLYWLRREHRLPQLDRGVARTFARPIVATLFVALVLIRPLHPLAPRAVIELAQLLALGPLLTLDASPRPAVTRLVALLYALDWARLLLDEHDAEHRVVLAAVAVLALLALGWCARAAEGPLRAAFGLGSLSVALGLAACLAGYVPLSGVLVEGTLASALVAVGAMAMHRAAMGWVEATLSTRAAENTVLGRYAAVTLASARRASLLLFALAWVWIALDYLRLRAAFSAQLERALSESIQLGEIEIALGEVLAFVFGIWAAVIVSRVLSRTLQEDLAPRLAMGPGVPAAAALIVRYSVLGLGFVLAASAAGIGLSQLSLFAGALGVGVGFGLQNVVSNFVSGLLLVFERPVKVGDTVDVSGRRGTIMEIGVRASTIRAVNGADIIIPNSKLIEGELVNWTHADPTIRVDFPVGVAYGSDVRLVHDTLRAAAASLPMALERPAPSVLLIGFGDSSIDFEVRVWIASPPDQPAARSQLGFAIQKALADAGIEIPFPQREVRMRTTS